MYKDTKKHYIKLHKIYDLFSSDIKYVVNLNIYNRIYYNLTVNSRKLGQFHTLSQTLLKNKQLKLVCYIGYISIPGGVVYVGKITSMIKVLTGTALKLHTISKKIQKIGAFNDGQPLETTCISQ